METIIKSLIKVQSSDFLHNFLPFTVMEIIRFWLMRRAISKTFINVKKVSNSLSLSLKFETKNIETSSFHHLPKSYVNFKVNTRKKALNIFVISNMQTQNLLRKSLKFFCWSNKFLSKYLWKLLWEEKTFTSQFTPWYMVSIWPFLFNFEKFFCLI